MQSHSSRKPLLNRLALTFLMLSTNAQFIFTPALSKNLCCQQKPDISTILELDDV